MLKMAAYIGLFDALNITLSAATASLRCVSFRSWLRRCGDDLFAYGPAGCGQNAFTLHIVRERARKENRAVYYHGIELLKPEEFEGWVKLEDASKWFELPDGAIIVHDEAQTLYRPRGNGAQVPQYVAELETHRHKGHDLYFITQHPMLIDSNVRRLAGEHMHVVRLFGAKVATLHRWAQCKEQCDKSRADSIRETVGYPAALFEAYKSATLHTHKARVPKRVFLLLAMPFCSSGCCGVSTPGGKGSARSVRRRRRKRCQGVRRRVRVRPRGCCAAA